MIDNALKDKLGSTGKRYITIVEIYEDVKGLNTGEPPDGYSAVDLHGVDIGLETARLGG